jgi:voltage-gated potassium channel
MPTSRGIQRARRRVKGSHALKRALLTALSSWNRNQFVLVMLAIVVIWLVASFLLWFVESGRGFDSLGEALWNAWMIVFNGPGEAPTSRAGKFLSMILVAAGVALAGLFTASVASVLVERTLRRREVTQFEMEDHLVLCNWSPRGLDWIREVHSKIVQDKRPVVIIHDHPEAIDLPDAQDDPAFNDVYIVKGDPTNEVVLRRARVARAHSVVVLSDERQGEYADGKTILTCISIRNVAKGGGVNIAVECHNSSNRHHLKKAGADEIISSDELGLRLLARSALYHGMTRVYQELLTVGRDANEMFLLQTPAELVGRDFVEVATMFLRHRDDRRSCLLIGIQRDDEMILNPVSGESGALRKDDELILLSRVFLNASQTLPTVPPIQPAASED